MNIKLTAAFLASAAFALATNPVVPYFRIGVQNQTRYEMSVIANNVTAAPATLTVEFFDSYGHPMEVPFKDGAEKTTRFTKITRELAPWQSYVANSESPSEKFQIGWVRLQVSRPGAITTEFLAAQYDLKNEPISGYSLLPSGIHRVQTLGPAQDRGEHIVIVNPGSKPQTVDLLARSDAGKELCRGQIKLGPNASHKDEILKTLACAKGNMITVEVSAAEGVSALMLRFVAGGGTVPVYANPGAATTSKKPSDLGTEVEAKLQDIWDVVMNTPAKK